MMMVAVKVANFMVDKVDVNFMIFLWRALLGVGQGWS